MNREEIKTVIPHRDPMLLVDAVKELEDGKRIVAEFRIDGGRDIFRGHFPGDPVLPGVYTIEIMAQTSDILILSMERYSGKVPLLLGVEKVKFMEKILPGDILEIHAEIIRERREKAIVTCYSEVFVSGKTAACGEVTLAMR